MLSDETQMILDRMWRNQGTQHPSDMVQDSLRHITLVCIVGASCMGKNSIMDKAMELDGRFGFASTVTSRPRQDRDRPTDYRHYYDHSDEGLRPLLDDIAQGKVVQYAFNPVTKYLMATYPEDYGARVNLRDVYATAVENFRQLGFGKLIVISLITPFDQWLPRFDQRFPPGDCLREGRLDEAKVSLGWSLAQTEAVDHRWLVNDGVVEDGARSLQDIIDGKPDRQADATELAQDFLQRIQEVSK